MGLRNSAQNAASRLKTAAEEEEKRRRAAQNRKSTDTRTNNNKATPKDNGAKNTAQNTASSAGRSAAKSVRQTADRKREAARTAARNTAQTAARKAAENPRGKQARQNLAGAQKLIDQWRVEDDQKRFVNDVAARTAMQYGNIASGRYFSPYTTGALERAGLKKYSEPGLKENNPNTPAGMLKSTLPTSQLDRLFVNQELTSKNYWLTGDKVPVADILAATATLDPLSALKADAASKANYGRARGMQSKAETLTDKEKIKNALSGIKETRAEARRDQAAKAQTLSRYDNRLREQFRQEIKKAKADYDLAKARGDRAAMTSAHRRAETWRRIEGGYSGGAAGNEYIIPELSAEEKAALNEEGQLRLRAAKIGWANAWNDADRNMYAAQGVDIRKDPKYQKEKYDRGAYRETDAEGRMRYAGTEEERQKEKEQAAAIPAAIGTGVAGSFLSIPGTTGRALQTDAARNQGYLQNLSDIRGGGEINISEPERRQTAQEKINALLASDRYQNASPTAKANLLKYALQDAVEETPLSERLLNKSDAYREKALEGQKGLERYLTEALITGGEMIPGLAATALTGGAAAPGLAVMGAQAAGGRMGRLEAAGEDPVESFNRGLVTGLIEAGTEMVPLKNLTKIAKGGGNSFARNMLTQALEEVATEELSDIGNYAADKAFRDPNANLTAQDLKDTAIISLLTSLGMGTGAGAIGARRTRPQNVRQEVSQTEAVQTETDTTRQTAADAAVNDSIVQREADIQTREADLNRREQRALERMSRSVDSDTAYNFFRNELRQVREEQAQLEQDKARLNTEKQQVQEEEQTQTRPARDAAQEIAADWQARQRETYQARQDARSQAWDASLDALRIRQAETAPAARVEAPTPLTYERAAERAREPEQVIPPAEAQEPAEAQRSRSPGYNTAENHIDNRQTGDVNLGDRKVKAFQWDHPEVKPFFQKAAAALKRDVEYADSTKHAQRASSIQRARGMKSGTVMEKNDVIRNLMNRGLSTTDIIKACDAIINDEGQENYATAKRVELALDDMLSKGYTPTDSGYKAEDKVAARVPPDADYLAVKDRISGAVKQGSWERYLRDNEAMLDWGEVTEDELRAEWEAMQEKPEEAETPAKPEQPEHTSFEEEMEDLSEQARALAEEWQEARRTNPEREDYYREQARRIQEREQAIREKWAQKNTPLEAEESTAVNTNPEQHTPAEQAVIEEYQNAVDDGLVAFARRVRTLQNPRYRSKVKYSISPVSEKAAEDIKRLTGIDVSDYDNIIDGDGIDHIDKRHGINGKANQSMADDNDIGRIGYVLENYDSVDLIYDKNGKPVVSVKWNNKDGSPAEQIKFTKKINGTFYVIEAVPDTSRKSLVDTSAFMKKKSGNTDPVLNLPQSDQQPTSKTLQGANIPTSQTSISQTELKRNGNFAEEAENVSGEAPYSVGAAPGGFDPYSRMLNEYGAIEPGMDTAEGMPEKRFIDVPRSTNGKNFVRRGARTLLESPYTSDETARQIERDIVDDLFSDNRKGLDEMTERAYQVIEEHGTIDALARWEDIVAGRKKPNEDDLAMGAVLYAHMDRIGNTEAASRIAGQLAAELTTAGRMANVSKILKRAMPEDRIFYLRKSLDPIKERVKKRYASKKKQHKIDEIKLNEDLVEQYRNAGTQEEADAALDQLWQDFANQAPLTVWDRLDAWRYFAMLGNPRTHVRNTLGNFLFGELERASGKLSAGLQHTLPKGQRTRTVMPADKKAREFAKQDYEKVKNTLLRGGKYTDDVGTISQKIRERAMGPFAFNSKLLEWEDAKAKSFVYKRTLAQYLNAKGWDPDNLSTRQLNEARDFAVHNAKVATFTEENIAAKQLARAEQYHPVLRVAVGSLIPFKGVPANMVKQGFVYSPINMLLEARNWKEAVHRDKAMAQIEADLKNVPKEGRERLEKVYEELQKVANEEKSAAEAIDGFSKGLTGTAIATIGFLLAAKGILAVSGSDDDDIAAMEAAEGNQNYSLKINGHTYTIDWAAPTALPLFVGGEFYNGIKSLTGMDDEEDAENIGEENDDEGNEEEALSKAIKVFYAGVNAGSRLFDPLINLTVLQGVSGMTKEITYGGGNASAIVGYIARNFASQFVPTLSGQIARTADDTRRTTFVDKNSDLGPATQRFIQMIENKIPGVSKINLPYLDVWGRESKQDNVLLRALGNFVSPGYLKKVEDSEVDDELKRLGIFPKLPAKNGKVDGNFMTKDQYENRAKTQGKTSLDMLTDAMNSDEYNAMSDEEKTAYVKKIFGYAKEKGKEAAGAEKITEWVSNMDQAAKDNNVEVSALMRACMHIDNTGDADGNGSVKTEEAWNAIQDMDGPEALKRAAFAVYNGTDNTYDEYKADAEEKARKQAEVDKYFSTLSEEAQAKILEACDGNLKGFTQEQAYVTIKGLGLSAAQEKAAYNGINVEAGWVKDGQPRTWESFESTVSKKIQKNGLSEPKEKKETDLSQYFDESELERAEEVNDYIESHGGYFTSLTQWGENMAAMGVPKSEWPTYFNYANIRRGKSAWGSSYEKAAKDHGWNDTLENVKAGLPFDAEDIAEREDVTGGSNDYRITEGNPLAKLIEAAAAGSEYKMKNWLNSRKYNQKEDNGTTLEQVKRLASLYGAVYPTTQGYTKEQARDLQEQARNAPVVLQDLIIKHGDQLSPIVDLEAQPEDQGAYFDRKTGKVYGVLEDIAKNTYERPAYDTHWHEYGHNLDWLSDVDSLMYSAFYRTKEGDTLSERISDEVDSALRDYWTKVRGSDQPYDAKKALEAFYIDMKNAYPLARRNTGALSDMISPYSVEHGGSAYPLGWGHRASYWDSARYKRAAEAFADLTSASAIGGQSLEFIQSVLPKTYQEYLEMLAKMAAQ